MADNRYAIGGFAQGFTQALNDAAQRRRLKGASRAIEDRNEAQRAMLENRGRAAEAISTIQQGPQQQTLNPLTGDVMSASDPAIAQTWSDPGETLRQEMANAIKNGDDALLKQLQDAGLRGAMAHIMSAKGSDPAGELSHLNRAASMLGLGTDAFSRNGKGNLVDPYGNEVTPERRPGLYNWLANEFRQAGSGGEVYAEMEKGLRGEARDQAKIDQEDARLDLMASELSTTRERMRKWYDIEQRKMDLAIDELDFDKEIGEAQRKLWDAQGKALMAEVEYDNARAAALGIEGVDPKDALNAWKERAALMDARTDPMYTEDPTLRDKVGSFADEILRGTKFTISPTEAIQVAEDLVKEQMNPGSGILKFDHDWSDRENPQFWINDKPVPARVGYMVGSYLGVYTPPTANPTVSVDGVEQKPRAAEPTGINDPYLIPKTLRWMYDTGRELGKAAPTAAGRGVSEALKRSGIIEFFAQYDWDRAGDILTGKQ